MRKTLELGKVDYNGSGRRNCRATFEWELKDDGNFTMSANIWNPKGTDIYCGGQCVDEVASYFPGNHNIKRMADIWGRWHLNNMKAGCEHQRALGWAWESNGNEPCPICGYKYGTAWFKEEIPQNIKDEIKSWEYVEDIADVYNDLGYAPHLVKRHWPTKTRYKITSRGC